MLGYAWTAFVGLGASVGLFAFAGPRASTESTDRTPAPQAAAQAQAAAIPDGDAAAVMALVERYFAAGSHGNEDVAFRLWNSSSEARRFVQMTLARMLQTSNPSWSNVRVSQVALDGTKGRAHVEFDLSYQPAGFEANPAAGQASAAPRVLTQHVRDVVTFVREAGEWRIDSEISEAEDIAKRLLATPDEAALNRLLAEEGPRIDFGVLQALYGIGGEASMRRNYADGIRATSLGLRLAEAKAAEAANPEAAVGAAVAESYILRGLTDLASVYAYKPDPDFPKAIALLTRALAIQERNKDEGGAGNTLQARGNAYYSRGDYSRALDDYQRALTLQTRQTDDDGAARSRLGVGNVQFLFGQFDLALDAYQQALQTFEQMKNVEPQPRALMGLGRVYEALGDYARSRDLFTRALALFTAASRRSEQASALRDIGHVFFLQGKLDEAATHFGLALAIDTELKNLVGQGRALFALGLLQLVRGRYDDAIQTYTRSAEAFTRADSRDGLGQVILARAAAKFEQHDLAGALTDYTESARTFEAATNRDGVARANVGLAMTHVIRRDVTAALDAAHAAWRMAEQAGAPEIGWQAQYESGRASVLAGDADRARHMFEEAIATLERSQFEAGGDADAPPPARREAPYVALVEWHVAHGDATRALLLAEAAKRRLLQDLLLPYRFRLARGLTLEQQREERRLFSQRVSIAKQIRRTRQQPTPDAAGLAQLETQLEAARAAAAEWDRTLARDHVDTAFQRGDADFSSPTHLAQLAQQLNDTSALVHFVVGEERTTMIVATRKSDAGDSAAMATAPALPPTTLDVRAYTIETTRAQLAGQVAHFIDAITRRLETIAADGRSLYDRLLGPAHDQLAGRTQLVIVPDDSLWILPFQALRRPDDRYVEQDVSIVLLPSAAAWVLRPQPAPAATPPAAATQAATSVEESGGVTLVAGGTVSDVAPFHSTLTLVQPPATSETLAAWELFDHPLHADSLLLLDRTPADEQIRIDQGRLGAVGLAWALQVAGVPRVTIARWPLSNDERERARRRLTTAIPAPATEPREWAAWMHIGPPQPPASPEPPRP